MKKGLALAGKIALAIGIIVAGLALEIFGLINLAQPILFSEYHSIKSNIQENYSLNGPHTPQGISYIGSIDHYITSCYTKRKDLPAGIFFTKNDYARLIEEDGSLHQSHVGGISVHEKTNSLFIANDKSISRANLNELIDIIENANISTNRDLKITKVLEPGVTSSFVSVTGDTLCVGEFHNGKAYKTDSHYELSGEVSNATLKTFDIVGEGSLTDLTFKDSYALPNEIQGAAIKGNYLYLSKSYGIAPSSIYTYDISSLDRVDGTIGVDTANVQFLKMSNRSKTLTAPMMTEDLEIVGDMLVTMSESASNAYIIGKLYFANKIVGLPLEKLNK